MVDRALLCLVVALALGSGVSCKPDTPPETANEADASSKANQRHVARPLVNAQAPTQPKEEKSSRSRSRIDPEAKAIQLAADTLEQGAGAYRSGMCSKCHRDDGTGGLKAPDLTDTEWLHCDGSIEGIRQVLIAGVSRDQLKDPNRRFAMNPATNLVPDEEQIAALAAYVYSLSES